MLDIKNDELKEVVGGNSLSSNQEFEIGDWVDITVTHPQSLGLNAFRITDIIENGDNTIYKVTRYDYHGRINKIAMCKCRPYPAFSLLKTFQPSWLDESIVID